MTMVPTCPEALLRTARKTWHCIDCQGEIQPGTHHVEYIGEAHAFESGTRYCMTCAFLAGWIEESTPNSSHFD